VSYFRGDTVDESSFNVAMHQTHGWSMIGTQVLEEKQQKSLNISLIAAISSSKIEGFIIFTVKPRKAGIAGTGFFF
jgi:hypothetical protein